MKFLNATQHALTPAQTAAAGQIGAAEIINLRDFAPDLFARLANTPADLTSLVRLADEFAAVAEKFEFVHLPIGSPAFQFVLAQKFSASAPHTDLLFSHSVRASVDEIQPDGTVVKKAVFNFESFVFVTDVPR